MPTRWACVQRVMMYNSDDVPRGGCDRESEEAETVVITNINSLVLIYGIAALSFPLDQNLFGILLCLVELPCLR